MKPIRVLIVDDSATMRRVIASHLTRDPGIVVVGEAADPLEARQAIKDLNPDVMTLDLEMPHMNGLDFLEKVMRLRPFPVVMISSLTAAGAAAGVRGLELGAVECIGKPTPQRPDEFDELPEIIRAAASAHTNRAPSAKAAPRMAAPAYVPDGRLVAIGASTGGVEALISVLTQFPANCPPTVVALHLPAPFTTSLAQRLDRLCPARVSLAADAMAIEPGHVYLAPGTATHMEVAGSSAWRCRLTTAPLVNGHRPSVDVLFQSVAQSCGKHALGVILTGMGRDGASGLLSMRRAGARTLGQSEASCVVFGMPKVALEIGASEKQVPLHNIGAEILLLTNRVRG